MKKFLKISAVILLILCLIIGGLLVYITQALPNIPAEDIKVEITPTRLKRGEYLANHVAVCMDCHSERDWDKFSGPPKPGTFGKGGEVFDEKFGFPGRYVSANITPYGLKDWTDGEILRAFTSGVGKNNRSLFPVMPYKNYGKVSKEDMLSIIAYIKTIPPVVSNHAPSYSNFPMNIIIHTLPTKATFNEIPDTNDHIRYGEYLTTMANCIECHTPFENGRLVMKKAFAGGRKFKFEHGTLTAPNITFDNKTGIGSWTKERFIQRFKYFEMDTVPDLQKGEFNTIMPWTQYAGMTESDLGAIYEYLKSLEPMSTEGVVIFTKN